MTVIRRYDGVNSHSLSYLSEINRRELVFKSIRQSPERVQRSKKYKISGKMEIDVGELLEKDRITVEVPVSSPNTPTYICTIQFNKVIKTIIYVADHQWYRGNVNLDTVEKALGKALDEEKYLKVNCTCPDFYYRYSYVAYKNGYKQGLRQPIPAPIRNPHDNIGSFCKHLIMLLKNRAWVRQLAQVVNYLIKQEYDKIVKKFKLDTDKFYINKSGQHNKSTVELPKDRRSALRKPRSRFLEPNDGEESDEGENGDDTEIQKEGVNTMAVRLLREKFSPSLPDWVKDAIKDYDKNHNLSGFPWDTVEFVEKPIPQTQGEIQKDYENGYAPVIQFDRNGKTTTVVIKDDGFSNSSNASYKFKQTLARNLPWGLEDTLKKDGWKWIQRYITKYGVIMNRKADMKSVSDKRNDRRSAQYHIPEIPDPEDYMRGLKKDAVALRYKKQMDVLYDEINDIFDAGMVATENMTDRDANACFRDMEQIERKYNSCLKSIDYILGQSVSSWRDYDEENEYSAKEFRRNLEDLNILIDEFKARYNV